MQDRVNTYRFWSPEHVIAQIDTLVNQYGVRNIKIADEMFVLNQRHVMGICDRIIERGYDLNIWAYTRVDTIKDGMLEKLKAAGFNWLAFGIEAGDDRVRADVDKAIRPGRNLPCRRARFATAGINVIGNYIFGLPEDDLDTMQATLDHGSGTQLRVRQFLLGDGLSRLAAVYPRRASGLAAAEGVDGLFAALARLSAAADPSLAGHVRCFASAMKPSTPIIHIPNYLGMVNDKFGPETVKQIRQMTSPSAGARPADGQARGASEASAA